MKKPKIPTVAITGASGFLGSILVDHFLDKGWNVVALVRSEGTKKHIHLTYRPYDITKQLTPNSLSGIDYLIHAAYVKLDAKNPDAMQINISGAQNILDAAKAANVSRLVFISTMSAHEEAISVYGKQKLTIEDMFLKQKNTTVLRCGLIIGKGGIVNEMAAFMKSKHAVPLIGGGKQPLQIIDVHDLALVIDNAITKSLSGRFVAATPEVYTYKDFYAALAKSIGVKIVYVPVPYWILEGLFKTAAALNITLGVGEDNLKGLKKLKSMPSTADLKKIGVKLKPLNQALHESRLKG